MSFQALSLKAPKNWAISSPRIADVAVESNCVLGRGSVIVLEGGCLPHYMESR